MKTTYAKFKLYLEGIVTKFNALSINESGYSAPTMEINLPANANAMALKPGTLAQLFYSKGGEYYIVFEGELSGQSFSKSGQSEAISLQFQGLNAALNRTYKIPNASISNVPKQLRNFLVMNAEGSDGDFTTIAPEIQAALDNFSNNLQSFKEFFEKVTESLEEGSDNALEESFYRIVEDAEDRNNWYKYFAECFKMRDRYLAFSNNKAGEILDVQMRNIFNRNQLHNLGNMASINQVLYAIMEFVGYIMLNYAAPRFGDSGFKSTVMLPNNFYLAPVRNNIFFGDQTASASFNKNHIQENTRISATSSSLTSIIKNGRALGLVQPTVLAPDAEALKTVNSGLLLDYRTEEQYIGIVPSFENLVGIDDAFANIRTKEENEERNKVDDQASNNELAENSPGAEGYIQGAKYTKYMKRIVSRKYWNNKFKVRSFGFTTYYDPNRIAGMQGIFIDKNVGTVAGQINNITTNISADGQATSTISFIYPRIIWEWDDSGAGLQGMDPTPQPPAWFEADKFSFDNIGKEVYNEILGLDSDKDVSSIGYFKSLESYKRIEERVNSGKVDLGILQHWGRDQETMNTEYTNSLKLSAIVKAIKDVYYQRTEDDRDSYVESLPVNTLMDEKTYWRKLFGNKDRIDQEGEYYPYNIVKDQIYREVLGKNPPEDDIISIDRDYHSEYKMYIRDRADAVRRLQ